jgi:hypothetical protein
MCFLGGWGARLGKKNTHNNIDTHTLAPRQILSAASSGFSHALDERPRAPQRTPTHALDDSQAGIIQKKHMVLLQSVSQGKSPANSRTLYALKLEFY